jgi:sugar transferase (PEP-CTERM system associated)
MDQFQLTRRILTPIFLLVSLDFLLAAGSFCLSYLLRFQLDMNAAAEYTGPLAPRAITFAFWILLGLLAMGLYRARQRPWPWETAARVLFGTAIGGFCYILFFFLLPELNTGRGVVIGGLIIACITICAGRLLLLPLIDQIRVKPRVLVLGSGSAALKIGKLRRASDRRGFEVVGYVKFDATDRSNTEKDNSLLRPEIPLDAVADFVGMHEVVVALDERRGTLPTELLSDIKSRGVPVTDILSFLERETGRIDLDFLSPGWFVYTKVGFTNATYRVIKRLTDIFLSALILALTAPIFLVVALLIWIESGGRAPVFYRQSRVGLGGRRFRLLKFRSMKVDAESKSGPLWSVKDDDRVTLVGKIIRRFRIDELPQLINILKGEMSIVGPRPERPEFVDLLTENVPMFNVRHSMRPGLTGWAQLNFPYGASVTDARQKLSYGAKPLAWRVQLALKRSRRN